MARWVQDPETLKLVPRGEYYARKAAAQAPYIQPDLAPYKNMIDFTMVDGRKAHREFLARNGVQVVEDTPSWLKEKAYNERHRNPRGG
jgi:hypothetical protein